MLCHNPKFPPSVVCQMKSYKAQLRCLLFCTDFPDSTELSESTSSGTPQLLGHHSVIYQLRASVCLTFYGHLDNPDHSHSQKGSCPPPSLSVPTLQLHCLLSVPKPVLPQGLCTCSSLSLDTLLSDFHSLPFIKCLLLCKICFEWQLPPSPPSAPSSTAQLNFFSLTIPAPGDSLSADGSTSNAPGIYTII